MKCDFDGCNDQFIDTHSGLAQMMYHKIIKHNPEEINSAEQTEMLAIHDTELDKEIYNNPYVPVWRDVA